MTKRFFGIGLLVLVVMFGMAFTGCDSNDDYNSNTSSSFNNNAGDLAGDWRGQIFGATADVTISSSGWTLSIPSQGFIDTGVYNRSGDTATLHSHNTGNTVGMAKLVSIPGVGLVLELTLNQNSLAQGIYNLMKQ
jgi:hypothetical protein